MIDYRSAQAVAMVVRTGSFERAARALNVTPSAVSQRVKQIEERLGAALVVRGNPCRATMHGEYLLRHIERIGLLENELAAHLPELMPSESFERPTITIAANSELVGRWVLEAVKLFTQHSSFLVDISVSDDATVKEKLRLGEILAAITLGDDVIDGHEAVSVGRLRCMAVATPNFANQYFTGGVTSESVRGAPGLVLTERDALSAQWTRLAFGEEVYCSDHRIPSTMAILEATLTSMGWSLLPVHLERFTF
ncbi:ArgP/LysG family DNA-binding transcriptional regulator [Rhizobium binxianense]|uniref:ArgP/LysG family DNA-binding transcriptional regulator n=1 Tax=Rhizobium binxianense TaxID=3024242 RepID=UPI00235F5D23|nr:ArgP/LysG family DNA-binding transcriptional regulator [Rhizobium sp. MJ37]MDC9837520.1 ArgP/LysG family DNA-binding transcriptional regulator [Rhizobium sp. MJ37]